MIGTDNSANLSIAMGTATPKAVKPILAKWAMLKARIAEAVCTMVKVDTHSMPVDFMTKWLSKEKAAKAIAYLTNSRNAVW